MEPNYVAMPKERMAIVIKFFKVEIVIGERAKEEGELPVQFDVNNSFFARLIDKISNWFKSLFGE